jgi:hypothetical protein
VDAAGFGIAAHLVQKHGFAYTSEPNEHHALGRTAQAEALEADLDILANLVSAG